MKVMEIRPDSRGGNIVARFDAETPFGVRFYNLVLKRAASGWRVFSPQAHGGNTATFSHELNDELVRAAVAALGGVGRFDTCE